jgi:4-hydroxybenzoate polyprenyltransferase
MPAALRLIHPAPAVAVTLASAVLGLILADGAEAAGPRLWLTVLAVAGSQVFTGATNDLADMERDIASGRSEKPLVSGALTLDTALWIASAGLGVQLAASVSLGWLPLALGIIAVAGAVLYNLALSRTPYSPIPYLVSFGVLPLWIASGVGVGLERVLPAVPPAALLAVAAHLANILRDFDADATTDSRSLAQVIGRGWTRTLAVASAVAAGVAVGLVLLARGPSPGEAVLWAIGLGSVVAGARRERDLWYTLLVAAVAWTAAWAMATG